MKAVRVVPGPEGGKVEVQAIPVPVAAAGQVLVRVRAAGLNRGEINQAKELRSGNTITTGVEFAGEIAEVGEGVSGWRKGDRVMGHGRGCQAEYVVADPLALIPVPDGMSWIDAAAFPNVFITAHDALVTNGRLVAGESVLVNGASGGVAMATIQIASLMGARPVIASSRSAAKLDKIIQFGVDVGIDASQDDQVEAVLQATDNKGVDIIIDTVGGPVFEANMKSLAVKGRLVNIARLGSATAQIDLAQLWLKRLQLIGVTFRTRTEQERLECIQACARDMLPFLRAGRVRLPIDRTFAMTDIDAAHAYMKQDQHVGKIVLLVD
ncbi:NADPH:quinone reductase or related Zn-dependent oxidoreductase [Cupriavidus necator]|uniref:Acryloyl-CoA reductase n=1 Tax=Cupriavidus necator (strain ATCC 17699 / DSM 428 / KCTC 22496 / NCIMB 10442 / H16 / Stanier 337) TaxID=381666 RepID=Q0KC69_CUPNH|nr:zinc-binding dehydrogenase [Cupriavidus necator]QCC00298.1 acryloyl-CoA reductase [Cupriavidus necator H16]QQB76886.1 zinc-binding dehydrogenase [Cupriavidus necator]WKA42154.1 zinc-binding dehydrogenase [Cupriavidus necator]CAJ92402.1 NADPH:quinone reductase or related Zn-dependent oxidoreductase [Cupriavidus necator H16]